MPKSLITKTPDNIPADAPAQPTPAKYTKDLLLLLAIPGGIALIAALAVYIPQSLAKPKSDFIYAFCEDYRCADSYVIEDGRIKHNFYNDNDNNNKYDYPSYDRNSSLRYYDADENSYRTITLSQAQTYNLDTSAKSPDGYTLSSSRGSGFLFWDDYKESWYLKNGAKRKKVELVNKDTYYSDNVTFLGWVKE